MGAKGQASRNEIRDQISNIGYFAHARVATNVFSLSTTAILFPLFAARVWLYGKRERERERKTERTLSLTVVGVCAGFVEVGHGVVRVVLVLPPPHAEALHKVAPEDAGEVPRRAVLKHLRRGGGGVQQQDKCRTQGK